MAGRKGNPMSWKSILTSIVSAATLCAGAAKVEWEPVNRYEQSLAYTNDGWYAASAPAHAIWLDAFNAETGRVRNVHQFLPHENDPDFFIRYLQRQYSNDMQTIQGRVKWHGKPIAQEIDDTNRMCKIERFADGTIHVSPFRKPQPYDNLSFHAKTNHPAWKASAAKRKAALEKRRAEIAARRNVLPGLKEAQLKTFDNKNTESNVTVNVNIGGGNGR